MASSRYRRNAPARRMTRRVKADWVYRPNIRGTASMPGSDGLGTYETQVRTLSTGTAAAQALVLYDSHNATRAMRVTSTGYNPPTNAMRAEGQRAMVMAVEVSMYVEPSTWAVGNVFALGSRLMIAEQNQDNGVAILAAGYSMWNNNVGQQPADFANSRRTNITERRFFQGFDTNDTLWHLRWRWRGRYRLEPNEAFYLYLEAPPTSVNVRYQTWCRTLVSDEG